MGFLPVECIGALKQGEDVEWPNSKGSPLELMEPRDGLKGVVTMLHDGEALWARDGGANELFVFLVACDLAPAHRSQIGKTSNMSQIARAMVSNCASVVSQKQLELFSLCFAHSRARATWLDSFQSLLAATQLLHD